MVSLRCNVVKLRPHPLSALLAGAVSRFTGAFVAWVSLAYCPPPAAGWPALLLLALLSPVTGASCAWASSSTRLSSLSSLIPSPLHHRQPLSFFFPILGFCLRLRVFFNTRSIHSHALLYLTVSRSLRASQHHLRDKQLLRTNIQFRRDQLHITNNIRNTYQTQQH